MRAKFIAVLDLLGFDRIVNKIFTFTIYFIILCNYMFVHLFSCNDYFLVVISV